MKSEFLIDWFFKCIVNCVDIPPSRFIKWRKYQFLEYQESLTRAFFLSEGEHCFTLVLAVN
jgi:hypothetical protein